jgi:hypothetical protein
MPPLYSVVATTLAFIPVLGGCSKGTDERLYGTWQLDREYTERHLPNELIATSDAPSSMLDPHSAKVMLVKLFLDKFSGMSISITPQAVAFAGGGQSQEQSYEIVARGDNLWILKTQDGKLESFTLDQDRLSMTSTGDIRFTVYFVRTPN